MKFCVKICVAVAVAVVGGGCSDNKGRHVVANADAPVDSVEALSPLPDTVFATAAVVNFSVEECDGSDGRLDDLADLYADSPGVFTFRKGAMRRADFGGKVKGTPSKITVDWKFSTDTDMRKTSVGTWGGGSGWTGQPVVVEWPDSLQHIIRSAPGTTAHFGPREVMFGSLASKVYFVNFDTGRPSREPIDAGNPVKGSISLDPTLNGNLYVGQGVPAQRPFGALVIDLFANRITHMVPEDPKALRAWGAYDSSALRVGRFLFRPGENGRLYKYVVKPRGLTLHSAVTYTVGGEAPGIEASLAAYLNYGVTADNAGNVICFNLDNLRPVWHYSTGDDTDATPVIDVEDGHPYVYVASEIDRQAEGVARMSKLDLLNGKPVWERNIPGRRHDIGDKHFDGGFYATPLLGSGNCADVIFANMVYNTDNQNGALLAFSRKTGETLRTTPLRRYAWSSPVGFLNEAGEMFIVDFDCYGRAYLINGSTGEIISTLVAGANFESSAAVVGNKMVIGSRGTDFMRLSVD